MLHSGAWYTRLGLFTCGGVTVPRTSAACASNEVSRLTPTPHVFWAEKSLARTAAIHFRVPCRRRRRSLARSLPGPMHVPQLSNANADDDCSRTGLAGVPGRFFALETSRLSRTGLAERGVTGCPFLLFSLSSFHLSFASLPLRVRLLCSPGLCTPARARGQTSLVQACSFQLVRAIILLAVSFSFSFSLRRARRTIISGFRCQTIPLSYYYTRGFGSIYAPFSFHLPSVSRTRKRHSRPTGKS